MLIEIKERTESFLDQLRMYSLDIAIMAVLLLSFVFIGAVSYLYIYAEPALNTQRAQREYFKQKASNSEWIRMHKKDGYPPVAIKETNLEEEKGFPL